MRFRTFLFALAVSFLSVSGLDAQVFFDTVSVRTVGPGMTHYHVIAPAIPWNIHILRVDLDNPYITLETVKANDRLASRETVRSMARRKTSLGHVAVGAVNGDFYAGDGSPITAQVAQGEIVHMPVSRPVVGFAAQNRPFAGNVSFSGTVILPDTMAVLHGVNKTRDTDQLILYNPYFGTQTGTNLYGTEVRVRPLTSWVVNDTVSCVVEAIESGIGNMGISSGRAVLSGHRVSGTMVLSRLQQNDTVRVVQKLNPSLPGITEVIGGYPKIVTGGALNVSDSPREPRTSAGFSADSSVLYLFTVDGRQAGLSVGMTFEELANFMIQSGVHQGVNLDGGGSTTMIIRDEVMNSPSDGSERLVSNALLVVSSAPSGPLENVAMIPRSARVFIRETAAFTLAGFDSLGNPAPVPPGVARYSCDPSIGTIDSVSGEFTAGSQQATGWVRVSFEGQRDSASVFVKTVSSVTISPRNIVADSVQTVQFQVQAIDIDGLVQELPLGDFTWSSTDPAVGTVDTGGRFKGLSNGTTRIVVSFGAAVDSATVHVQLAHGYTILDSLESVGSYYVLGSNLDSYSVMTVDSFATSGNRSVRIEYSFTGSATTISYIYLYTDKLLFGAPDSIIIDGLSFGHQHRMYYLVEDDNGEQFRLFGSSLLNPTGNVQQLRAPFVPNQEVVGGSEFHFPVRLKRIEVQLVYYRTAGVVYTGALYLDNLRVSYPVKVVTGVDETPGEVPGTFRLLPNFPNPFNPSTTISFSLPAEDRISLRVYDVRGRLVRTLLRDAEYAAGQGTVHWDGRTELGVPAATGLYIVRLAGNHAAVSRKAILLK